MKSQESEEEKQIDSGGIAEAISQFSDFMPRQYQKQSQEINYGKFSQNDLSVNKSSNFLLESSDDEDFEKESSNHLN